MKAKTSPALGILWSERSRPALARDPDERCMNSYDVLNAVLMFHRVLLQKELQGDH
jgi:hypothetical protein